MIDSYINSVVEFSWNSRKHMCVIADVSSNNRAVCYRVINSTDAKKMDEKCIDLCDSTGRKTDYLIDYKSRFYLPQNHFDRVIFKCSADSVAAASAEYSELPPLSELEEEYNKLYAQIKGLPPKDSKEKRKILNKLVTAINARKCFFLSAGDKRVDKNRKYGKYRVVPNKNGITAVFQGGKCGGK